MNIGKKSLWILLIIQLVYFCGLIIIYIFLSNSNLQELTILIFSLCILVILLLWLGFLIIRSDKYTVKQKGLLNSILLIIVVFNLISLILAYFSNIWVLFPIIGIIDGILCFILILFGVKMRK